MIESTAARHATLAASAPLDDPVEEAEHPRPHRRSQRHSHVLRTIAIALCVFVILYIVPTASAAATDRVAASPSSSTPSSVFDSLASLTKRQQEAVASTCACKAPEKRGAAFAVKGALRHSSARDRRANQSDNAPRSRPPAAAFIPILVVLSVSTTAESSLRRSGLIYASRQGITAGLTLGYMSLDTTQLNVLAKTGTEKQQRAARKVLPLRANGHLLLVYVLASQASGIALG